MYLVFQQVAPYLHKGRHNQETLLQNLFCSYCSQCCLGEQTGRKQNIFASVTQTLRLQHMLRGYANEKAFGKHSESLLLLVFFSSVPFPPSSPSHAT